VRNPHQTTVDEQSRICCAVHKQYPVWFVRRLLHYPSFLLFLFIALTSLGSNTMQLSANTFLHSSTFSPSVFSPALREKKTGKERALETGDTQLAGAYRTMESPRVRYSQRTRSRGVWMIPACPLPLLPGSSSRKVPDYCTVSLLKACMCLFIYSLSLFSKGNAIGIGGVQGGEQEH